MPRPVTGAAPEKRRREAFVPGGDGRQVYGYFAAQAPPDPGAHGAPAQGAAPRPAGRGGARPPSGGGRGAAADPGAGDR